MRRHRTQITTKVLQAAHMHKLVWPMRTLPSKNLSSFACEFFWWYFCLTRTSVIYSQTINFNFRVKTIIKFPITTGVWTDGIDFHRVKISSYCTCLHALLDSDGTVLMGNGMRKPTYFQTYFCRIEQVATITFVCFFFITWRLSKINQWWRAIKC